MIRTGGKHGLKICCLECGTPCFEQHDNSDFFFMNCHNEECLYYYAMVVVERRTGIVLSCTCETQIVYGTDGPKRVYPAVFDKDGKQVWPKT